MSDKKYYSQYNEDKFLDNIFKKKNGLCIEIGGFDGISGSTTYFFEKLGWNCIVVEPIPQLYQRIIANRKCEVQNFAVSDSNGETDFFIADGVEMLSSLNPDEERIRNERGGGLKKIRVKTKTLDSILEKSNFDSIDFITIDVEGHEMAVLKGFSIKKYNPSVLILENNSLGSGANEIEKYLKEFEYVKFKITGCNEWYTHQSNKHIYSITDILRTQLCEAYIKIKYVLKNLVKAIVPRSIIQMIRQR